MINDIPGLGKFEGNPSLVISHALYETVNLGLTDEQFGSVDENGLWEGMVIFGGLGYIVTEDSQGFFKYEAYSVEEAWSKYFADLAAYESYYANGDN